MRLLIFGIGLSAVAGIVLLQGIDSTLSSAVAWVLAAIIGIAILLVTPILLEIFTGRFDLFEIKNGFLLFLFMQFVVWPAAFLAGAVDAKRHYRFPITFADTRQSAFLTGMAWLAFGLLGFYLAYYIVRPKGILYKRTEWNGGRLVGLAIIYSLISCVAFVMLASQGGGILEFATHIDEFRNHEMLGMTYLTALLSLAPISGVLLCCHYFQTGELKWTAHFFLAFGIFLTLIGASRSHAVVAMLGYFVAWHYLSRPIRILQWKTVVVLLLLWVLNVTYVYFRRFGETTVEEMTTLDVREVFSLIVPRFIGAEALARVVDISEHNGYGGSILVTDFVTGWIPRFAWSNKPMSSGIIANTTFFYEAFNGTETGAAPPSFVGELYWSGGPLIVMGGMVVIGILLSRVRMLIFRPTAESIALYGFVFAFAFLANESMSVHLFRLCIDVLACVPALWFIRVKPSVNP